MKYKIRKISGVILFSTMLSVGVGIVPFVDEQVVHAESSQSSPETFPLHETPIKNVFSPSTKTLKTSNRVKYRPIIQNIDTAKATTISINDPILDEKYGVISFTRIPFVVKRDFKKGDKIKIEYIVSDPIKQLQLDYYKTGRLNEFEKDSIRRSPIVFFDSTGENQTIVTAENIDYEVNEEGTQSKYTFELVLPKDENVMNVWSMPKIIGPRNEIEKDSYVYKRIAEELETKDVVFVGDLSVKITDDNGQDLVSPFSLMRVNATKDNVVTATKNNELYSSLGFLDRFNVETLAPYSLEQGTQSIKSNVLNGGLTGGIVSPEVGQDLSIKDVDFGELSIGKVIEPIKEDKMVSVRDWTGGNGWKLTAQHQNADRNNSLQLGVQVDNESKVDLNNQAQLVTTGDSQLDVTTQSGEYTAKWGTHPTVGEFNNVIEWNLSANVTE